MAANVQRAASESQCNRRGDNNTSRCAVRTGREKIGVTFASALRALLRQDPVVLMVGEIRDSETAEIAIQAALDGYRLDNGGYPTTAQGLRSLMDPPTSDPVPTSWRGPYLRKDLPLDPWGRTYLYSAPGPRHPNGFDLSSLGRDGMVGGENEDADIVGQ